MSEAVHVMPLSALRESPSNPRKLFDDTSMQELVASVIAQGVMQPIVARPLGQADVEYHAEIVFGHRRFRAARLAGLDCIPTIIREYTDDQVASAQLHENLERKDIHPIEEAEAFAQLMEEHGATVDNLVKQTGKSRSYVYGRAKVARTLCEEVKAACLRGDFGMEIALLIARYCPRADLQKKAATDVMETVIDYDTTPAQAVRKPMPYRKAASTLKSRYCISIADASFDPDDDTLIRDVGACYACPKLASNDRDLADKLDADVCTDPDCYTAKRQAHFHNTLADARKRGLQIIEGDQARELVPHEWNDPREQDDFVALDDPAFEGQALLDGSLVTTTFREALSGLGKKAPKHIVLVNPHKAHETIELLAKEDALKLLAKPPAMRRVASDAEYLLEKPAAPASKEAQGAWPFDDGDEDDGDEPSSPEDLAVTRYWPDLRNEIMHRAAQSDRTTDDMRLVAEVLFDLFDDVPEPVARLMGWEAEYQEVSYGDQLDWVRAKLQPMAADELGRFVVLLALSSAPTGYGDQKPGRAALASRYGIDMVEFMAARGVTAQPAEPASTPTPAARAPEEATAKGQAGVKYRNAETGETWSGRGLRPAWLKAAIASGKSLSNFELPTPTPAARAPEGAAGGKKDKKRSKTAAPAEPDADEEQKDDAGSAGGQTHTVDAIDAAKVPA